MPSLPWSLRKVTFNHTRIHAQRNKKTILEYYARIIDSGCFLEGSYNEQLTHSLAKLFNTKYVTLVSSGHDALSLALQALHLRRNDEVIFPVNAYPTAFPIALSGAKLVAVDVDENGQLDPTQLAAKISRHTKAIIVVHMYGLVTNLVKIKQIIGQRKIILIEDCAQAFCSSFLDQYIGTFGDIACFSFYPTKNVGTLGDGGAILTRHAAYHAFFQKAKKYGETQKYQSEFVAGHSRLPELQAAALCLYIQEVPQLIKKKTELYYYYCQKLRESKLNKYVRYFVSHSQSEPLVHLFVVEVQDRERLQAFLLSRNIETAIHYPVPVHQVAAFAQHDFAHQHFPVAEQLSKNILSLPFHQYLSFAEIDYIVKNIREFYEHHFSQETLAEKITAKTALSQSVSKKEKITSLSIFFPAYNDEKTIPELVARAVQTARKITKNFEIIVVNDGSSDQTQAVLERLRKKYPTLRIIHHQQNRGYGGALISGITHSTKQWVFYTDGDGQYDPRELLKLVDQLTPEVDVVNGYKLERQDSWERQVLGGVYNWLLQVLYPLPIQDVDCDFRLMRRSKLEAITLESSSGAICLELVTKLAKAGAVFREIGVHHYPRAYGQSQFFTPTKLIQTATEQFRFFLLSHKISSSE